MRRVIEALHARILDAEADEALSLAQVYGGLLWAVDIGIYEAGSLERHLVEQCRPHVVLPDPAVQTEDILHVISEPYLHGGHTRLMERLVRMHDAPVDLFVSRAIEPPVRERLAGYFRTISLVQGSGALERLQSVLLTLQRYRKVILHLHPDDILTIVACGLLKELFGQRFTVFFVNHADHVFSFSASVADYFFEISAYGHALDKKRNLIARKSFLGIPVADKPYEGLKPLKDSGCLKVFTAASAFKFKPRAGLDIRPSIRALLSRYPNAQFWIIGANPLTNTWWWFLKIRYPMRLFIRRQLPYLTYLEFVKQADFYMDSYPLPGGTAFAEQLLSGQRCIGLSTPFTGYSPAERLKVATIDDLIDSIEHPRDSQVAAVVAEVLRVNGEHAVRARYLDCIERGVCSENELFDAGSFVGDIEFLQETGKISCMVPVEVLDALYRHDPLLAFRVWRSYAIWPGLKLALKWLIFKSKRLRKTTC